MEDGASFKIEVIDNDSTWGYTVKINNAKKPTTSGSGFNSYFSAVKDAEYFVMSHIKENKYTRWGMLIEPNPRIVELARQETLSGGSGGGSQEVSAE